MIRPKQLVPLYKGARTWLVAGSTCGPRPNSADGNPGNAQYEERKSNQRRDKVSRGSGAGQLKPEEVNKKSNSFLQVDGQNVHHRHPPVEPLAKPMALKGSSADLQVEGHAPSEKQGDGTQGGRGPIEAVLDSSQPIGVVCEVVRDSKTCESVSRQAGARGLHTVAHVDGGKLSEGRGGLSIANKVGFGVQSQLSRININKGLRELKPSCDNAVSRVVAQQPNKEASDPKEVSGVKESPNKLVLPGGVRVSDPGSQQQVATRSVKACRASKVDQVCSILRESRPGPSMQAALDHLSARLSSHQVNEVLKNQNEVDVAWFFFKWVKQDVNCKHDVHSYTTMIGLLGRARNFEVMESLVQEMLRDGIKPNVVTFNRLIHSYGKASRLAEALVMFHDMQKANCSPDRVTYCTLIDVHAKAGFHDIAMQLYRQMLQAGLQADTFTYSVIVNCLGKAGKLNAAHKLYQEMLDRGCTPNIVTHNIILDLHSKTGNWHLAMKHYNDMQDAGFRPNKVTYSIMMEVLGNSGHIQEAEHVIHEMELGGWELDTPIYGLIIDMWGKVGNAEKACMWYRKMLDAGLTTNVQICNSLGSTFLRLNDYDAAKEVLSGMPKLGLVPTLQTYTLLLSCCTMCKEQKHLDTVLHLLGSTGHPAHSFLCTLLKAEMEPEDLRSCVEDFFVTLRNEGPDCRRGFADALIDFFHKLENRAEAGCVWEVARANHLFPYAVKEKDMSHWSINLHVMSIGTALTAMSKTLLSFGETMLRTGRIPERVDIITGWGKRSKVTGASLVKHAVEGTLTKLNSPFEIQDANVGLFVSQGPPLYKWLHQPEVVVKLAL